MTISGVSFLVILVLAAFLFPEEFTYWSRRVRRFLRDDIKRRLSQAEWEQIEHEFDDLE